MTATLIGVGLAVSIEGAPSYEAVEHTGGSHHFSSVTSATCPHIRSKLRSFAGALGKVLVGTAYRPQFAVDDRCYARTAARQFNSVTPEIATFMNTIERYEGQFDFADADATCDFAREHRMRCQVHNVVWDPVEHGEWGIVPQWAKDQSPDERRRTMVRYVTRVGAHFAGKVDSYTVVNEAFDTNGHLVSSAWNTTGDDSYIFDAFRAARQADPRAKLFYNDFGAEDINPKSDAIFALAKRLHKEKTAVIIGGRTHLRPLIDGVGLQMHVGVRPGEAPDPDSVRKNISRLGRAGLRVRITEMDVRTPVSGGVASVADRQRQHDLYRDLVHTCLTASSCEGVTFWGFTDAHSWITENAQLFPGQGAAHLFDTKYQPKPAYDAIRAALERFAARASPSGASAGWRSSALIGGALTASRPRVSAGGTRPCGSSPAR